MDLTEEMKKRARSPWLTSWPMWVLANAIGWSLVTMWPVVPFFRMGLLPTVALAVSLLQWLCLRRFLDADYLWIWTSTLVYAVYLWSLVIVRVDSFPGMLLVGAIVLFACGWLQRWALSRLVTGSTAWVFVSPVASIVALDVAWNTYGTHGGGWIVPLWAAFGAIYGGLTGALLVALGAWTKPEADDSVPPCKRAAPGS